MASYNGENYAKVYVTKPASKADRGELPGNVRCIKEKYTLLTGVTYGTSDEILGPKLPPGALVLDAFLKIGATGATGIFELGHLASADASIARNDDAFVLGADAGVGADLTRGAAANTGILARFAEEVQLLVTASEATPSMAGDVDLELVLFYSID